MMSKVVVAVALMEEVAAFQAPAVKASGKAVKAAMFEEGDIGAPSTPRRASTARGRA